MVDQQLQPPTLPPGWNANRFPGRVGLSLFPGVDLLGRGLEEEGLCCVVRGPDPLWGGDVRSFTPPEGVFWLVFGGPPCQDFSSLRRTEPTGYGREMLAEFVRVVMAARPECWLLENVARVPDVIIDGYGWQRFEIDQGWYSGISRLRHIQFGSKSGRLLDVPRGEPVRGAVPCAVANDDRSFVELKRLQGLPDDFDLPGFTVEEKKRAVGNGVPIVMGRVLARAIRAAYGEAAGQLPLFDAALCEPRRCKCGCGRPVYGAKTYVSATCRKRAQRRREAQGNHAKDVD